MKRPTLVAVLLGAVLATLPAEAGAIPIHHHIDVTRPVLEGGKVKVPKVVVRYDVAPPYHPPKVTPEPVATNVPAEAPAPAPTPSTVAPPPAGGSGCVGMEAESGSAGYSATSANGMIGCYQISPDHYAAGGSCAGLSTDPAGQDACAGRICATEGPGAWTNPAGENPCGRLGG